MPFLLPNQQCQSTVRHEHWRYVSPPNQQIHWMQNGSDESGICTARCIQVAQPAVSENRTALMPTRESHSLIYQLMMIWMLHALYESCINTALAWSMSQIWLPHIYYQPQLATRSNPNNKNLTTNAKAVCIGLHSICSSSQTFVLKISEKAQILLKNYFQTLKQRTGIRRWWHGIWHERLTVWWQPHRNRVNNLRVLQNKAKCK